MSLINGWLAPAVQSAAPCPRETLVLSACAGTCQRSVRNGPWLYIRTYHDGYNWFPPEMLFDIDQDPHEQHDLAGQHPEICARLNHLLAQWQDHMLATLPAALDADLLWTVIREGGPSHVRGSLPVYVKWLEQNGLTQVIAQLRRRHADQFPTGGTLH